MSRRVAPTDLRSPISCVRSRTDISMMFMITMPPTTMPMATTAGMTLNKHAREALPEADQRVGRLDREIVCVVRPQPMRDPHRFLRAGHRVARPCAASGIFTEIVVV